MEKQKRLADVIKIEGDEIKPRTHWREALEHLGHLPPTSILVVEYLYDCKIRGEIPSQEGLARFSSLPFMIPAPLRTNKVNDESGSTAIGVIIGFAFGAVLMFLSFMIPLGK